MTSDMDRDIVTDVLDIVPDRPLSSLYDIACLYAACDVYDRFTSEYVPDAVTPEALRVMSPNKLESESLLDPEVDNSLIAARVDLSGDAPELGDPPVAIENLTEDLKYKIGFMARAKTARQTDYSISNSSNGDDVQTLAHDTWGNRFLRGRLERWPREVPASVADNDIIRALRTLGEDTEAMKRLEEALLSQATFDSTEGIVTVKIKLSPDDEYRYPGEIPELNEAGVQNRYEHLRDGLSVDSAHGPGVGYVSGETGEVVGGSGGIRGQYSKQQVGPFPNLQADDAWLSRPLSEPQAAAISTFDGFVSDFSFLQTGVRFHYIPYPIEAVDADLFGRFYQDVYRPLRNADDSEYVDRLIELYTAEVQQSQPDDTDGALSSLVDDTSEPYEEFQGAGSWLRLYGLIYVGGTDPSRVYVDEPAIRLDALTDLEEAYIDVLATVGQLDPFAQLVPQLEHYLPSTEGFVYSLLFCSFFDSLTAASPDPDDDADETRQGTADDPRFSRSARIFLGRPLQVVDILEEYNTFIERQQRQNQTNSREPVYPTRAVLAQYIQLQSLAEAELLRGGSIINDTLYDLGMGESSANAEYTTREERLEAFIDSHPMLAHPETRSLFLLGGLVGRLAAYQYNEEVSQKLTEQYPPSAVNRRAVPEITQDVLDRNYTYADAEEISSFNRRYTDRISDSMLQKFPDEWSLSEAETKWIYALGVAYGKQDTVINQNESSSGEEDTLE